MLAAVDNLSSAYYRTTAFDALGAASPVASRPRFAELSNLQIIQSLR